MEELYNEIVADLGINYDVKDKDILEKDIKKLISIASDFTNRDSDDKKLYPYIIEPAKALYINRGDEDKDSMSEGGESYTYKKIIKEMKENLTSIRILG